MSDETLRDVLLEFYRKAMAWGRDYAHSGTSLDYGRMEPTVDEFLPRIEALANMRDGFRTFAIPEGYHRRFSGSIAILAEPKPCDVCKRPDKVLFGYEKDYPNNPDLFVCVQCENEFIMRRRKEREADDPDSDRGPAPDPGG